MRAIKFRGMDIKGNWYYGNLSVLTQKVNHVDAGTYISNSVGLPFAYQVRPETAGQFTGLHDKNGLTELYEGDILELDDEFNKTKHEVVWGGKDYPAWTLNPGLDCETNDFSEIICGSSYTMEIIGNIYSNPELLAPPLGNNAEPIRNISEDDWRKDDR